MKARRLTVDQREWNRYEQVARATECNRLWLAIRKDRMHTDPSTAQMPTQYPQHHSTPTLYVNKKEEIVDGEGEREKERNKEGRGRRGYQA